MKKVFLALFLVLGILFVGCGNNESLDKDKELDIEIDKEVDKKADIELDKEIDKEVNIDLYFYDILNDKWIKEKSKANLERLKDTVIELRNNPLSLIPKNTKVNSLTIKNKIATVDLGSEFLNPNSETSASSEGKIYSIVNTLCLNKNLNIDGVMFLIDGKKVDIIGQSDGSMIFRSNLD